MSLTLLLWLGNSGCVIAQTHAPSLPAPDTITSSAVGDVGLYIPHVPPRALDYIRVGRALGLFNLAWNLIGLWTLLQSGLSARVRTFLLRRFSPISPPVNSSPPAFRVLTLYFLAYSLYLMLWSLPIGLAGFAIEHQYGFSRQSLSGFLSDTATRTGFGLIYIPIIWGGYILVKRSPENWWKWLWGLLVPLIFVQIVVQPILIAPLYNQFSPLAPGPLRDKILALAAQAHIKGGRVFVENTSVRTNHVNAYVTGLGPTTRIVLNDTALRLLPEDQILAMVGHEMGHYVEGHIWVYFVTNSLGAGAFLWLASRLLPWAARRWGKSWRIEGFRDLAALPLVYLVLSLFVLVQMPVEATLSRYLEHRADTFGLRTTHLNSAMARLFVGFAERDYSDPNPPRLLHLWFGSHPTLAERITFARTFHE